MFRSRSHHVSAEHQCMMLSFVFECKNRIDIIIYFKCVERAEEYSRNFDVDGQTYKIRLLDTGGLHEYTLLWKRDHADVSNKLLLF